MIDYVNTKPSLRYRMRRALYPHIPTIATAVWVLAWVAMTTYVMLY